MKSQYLLFLLFFLSICSAKATTGDDCYIAHLSIPIINDLDDVEERPDGSMYRNSSDLELAYDADNGGNQKVALRFQNINIPQGAEVLNAYIQFTTDEVSSGACQLQIRAEAIDNAPAFSAANYQVSSRNTTTTFVPWQPADWTSNGESGTAQQTPNLSIVIQEVVDRTGWAAANDLVIFLTGMGQRVAVARDGNAESAAVLHVEVVLPAPILAVEQLLINELMASNLVLADEFGERDDWLELYNAGEESVNIGGLYLTDDLDNLSKWQISAPKEIEPNGFAVIWTDDDVEQGGLHANFKLSSAGETVALVQVLNGDTLILDQITFGELPENISFGRATDGADTWVLFASHTAGSSNNDGALFLEETIQFSHETGFYSGAVNLSLSTSSGDPDVAIRYTLDGSTPDEESALYENSILMTSSTYIRAKAFKAGFGNSQTAQATFFINTSTDLPVFHIQTEPEHLWDDENGIYVPGTNGVTGYCSTEPRNWNQDWERPGRISLYEADGTAAFDVRAGIKIGGGCSRGSKMKSFNFFLRNNTYGDKMIDYQIFPNLDIDEFKRIKVRNGGNDWEQMLFRDGLNHTLLHNTIDLDIMAYRPVSVYLNGGFWGLYGLREFYNEDYLAAHYEVDADNLDIITNPQVPWYEVKEGDYTAFGELVDFMNDNSLASLDKYNWVADRIDINEFLNYHIVQIFLANYDWPANNVEVWRNRNNGKFRYLLFDTDATANFASWSQSTSFYNALEHATATDGNVWPNGPESTLFLRRLLEHHHFRNEFIQRTATYMHLIYDEERVHHYADSLQEILAPEIPAHLSRWANAPEEWGWGIASGGSVDSWNNFVEDYKSFFEVRPGAMRSHYQSKFNLSGTYALRFNYDEQTEGQVFLHSNDTAIPFDYEGIYFNNIPLQVKAVPKEGYYFVRWEETGETSPDISFSSQSTTTLTPIFSDVPTSLSPTLAPATITLQIAPNPASDDLHLSYTSATDAPLVLHIYNALGKIIWHQSLDTATQTKTVNIPVATWANGMYWIQLKNSTGSVVEKIIKETAK